VIFISYAREDLPYADRLYEKLLVDGYNPWLDRKCILPGSEWEQSIADAIRSSEYFIALLSARSIEKRGYVQKEIREALDVLQTIPFNRVFLIPVRLESCDPLHPALQRLQWVDFFPDWDEGYVKLNRVFSFVPREKRAQSFIGTRWIAKDSDGEQWEFILRETGVVEMRQHDIVQNNGKWRLVANELYIEFNNKYVQYRASIDNGILRGSAQNIEGSQWAWRATRII
jgi:hypothetical protein